MADETRIVTIKGRDIPVTAMTDTQFMLMGREMTRVQRLLKDEQVARENVPGLVRSMAYVLDIIETRLVNEDDRDYLSGLMADGELEFSDIVPIVSAFADDADKPVAVTRGRSNRTKR